MTHVESTRRRPADNGVRTPEQLIDQVRNPYAAVDDLHRSLADALERAVTDLDHRFAHSDHLSAKYYRRMRYAEKYARMRESESVDFARERGVLTDRIARAVEAARDGEGMPVIVGILLDFSTNNTELRAMADANDIEHFTLGCRTPVGQCHGHAACPVERHEHGCYADDGANCEHPDEHPKSAAASGDLS